MKYDAMQAQDGPPNRYRATVIAAYKEETDMANNNREMGGMLTVGEVAQLLYVHSNTLRRWTKKGMIKAYRIGPRGDRRFRREDIVVLLPGNNKGV